MKPYKLTILALILGILAIMPACGENECDLTGPNGSNGSGPTGTLRLLLTDRPLDALSIDVTILRVDAVPAGAGGPFTVVDKEQSFDLLTLENVEMLLGEAELPAGDYEQLRMIVKEASITTSDGTFDIKIPSGMQTGIKIVAGFTIGPGVTTTILLDFDARESVVERGAGTNRFLLKPVIHVKSIEMNYSPVAVDDYYEIAVNSELYLFEWKEEGGVITFDTPGIFGNDYDPDGDTLDPGSFTQVTKTANGAIWFAVVNAQAPLMKAMSARYEPYTEYTGVDFFTYTIQDEHGAVSAEATVTIAIGLPGPTGAVVGAAAPKPDNNYTAMVWLLDASTGETVTRALACVDGTFKAIAGEGIYDLVLTRNGYAPVIVEDVSVTAGQTVDVGTLTLTPRPGIYVHGDICQPPPLPAEMRLLVPSTGELAYLGLISVQSTGVFGFTFPEGTYDLVLRAGGRTPLVVEDILIERDEFGQCELQYSENQDCFPL